MLRGGAGEVAHVVDHTGDNGLRTVVMASAGSDWATNPVTQLRWCNGYAQDRYGSWAAAYNHWLAYRNW